MPVTKALLLPTWKAGSLATTIAVRDDYC